MQNQEESPRRALPEKPLVVRAGTAPAASLSPTDKTWFVFAGIEGQPEMFVNQGGRGDGTPLHRHPWATWEIVLEGRVRFVVNGEEIRADAGDFVYTPPNAPHASVVESERARIVGFNHPARRFAELQKQAEELFRGSGAPDMPRVMQLAKEYDLEILGPPLAVHT
jgi:quercetin dioxygenase-like cupin family protein